MAIASGWRREDAVVSEATQRLAGWVESGPWRARAIEEGAPRLALSLAALLDARAVLLLVRGEESSWQPAAWARSSGRGLWSTVAPLEGEGPAAGQGGLSGPLNAPSNAPLLRDEWDEAQAAFAARAALIARDLDLPAAAHASAPVRDSENSVADFEDFAADAAPAGVVAVLNEDGESPGGEEDSDWLSEAPSLLMLLPSGEAGDEEAAEESASLGAVVAWIESRDGSLSDEWRPLWSACAAQAGAWLEGALRFERVGRSYRDLTTLAARVVDSREARRAGHGPLVAYACALMARSLGLDEREVEKWEIAGLLHGVGRVAIPDALLLKEGALSPEEREVIRSAMQTGASWLGEIEGWDGVALLARHSGERWDGAGYPDGLSGDAIPLGSRALAIANRFATMAQGRPDRGALGSLRNVGAALESEAGRALDPQLVSLFLAALRGGAK